MSSEATRVLVVAVGACAAETMVWRMRGELRVTVIVKGTFAFQPDAPMRVIAPEEIVASEVHHANNPSRSVRLTTDLVPYLPAADVVLTGHACAPKDETALGMSVRLAVYREQALLDKSINVLCSTENGNDVPFETMPLVYEKAYGGVGFADNPFGVGAASPAGKAPNLADPGEEMRVACFAPIARGWPNRRKLLGKVDRKTLEAAVCEIPEGFNFAYFQAAPQDQQIAYLQGNEWVVLEGMHRVHPQICSCLPSAIGRARVFGIGAAGQGRTLALVADQLRIDADHLTCTVTWRGSFAVGDPSILGRLAIQAGIDTADRAVDWPPAPDLAAAPAPAAPAATRTSSPGFAAPTAAPAHAASQGHTPPAAPAPRASAPGQSPGATTQPSAVAGPRASSPGFASTVAASPEQLSGAALPFPAAPANARTGHADGSKTAPSPVGASTPPPPPAQAPSPQAPAAVAQAPSPQAPAAPAQAPSPPAQAPSALAQVAVARTRKSWDSTVEIGDQEPPRPSAATPFRQGPVNLPPPAAPPKRKPDFSATVATAEIVDQPDRPPPTLPFQRQHAAAAYARTTVRQEGTPPARPAPIAPAPVTAPLPPTPAAVPLSAPVTPLSPGVPPAPKAPAQPAGPKRPQTPEGIEIVNETPLVLGTARWDTTPSRAVLTVFAKATCDLVPDGPAAVRKAASPASKERSEPGPRGPITMYPSDFAPFKVRADVALVGHAHAPPGGAAEMEVRFKFGEEGRGFDRKLLVFGDRTWVKSGAFYKLSAPERFLQIPLTLDRAFGGKGHEKNPAGLGFFTGNPKSPVPMANLEDPNSRVRTPKQAPAPACFAPISPDAREPKNGADPAARSLPERFDWTRHQAAPPEQRLPFLRGDEPFEIAGIHPKLPVIKGALPGVAVRCVASRPKSQEEIPMRLDTVLFDLDEKTVTLVWRGTLTVSDERSPDVRSLQLVTAPLDDPTKTA